MLLVGLFALALMLLPTPASATGAETAAAIIFFATGTQVAATSAAAIALSIAMTAALSVALSYAASALLKPAARTGGGAGMPDSSLSSKQSVRQPTAPMQVVYGKTKVGGVYADLWMGDATNQLLCGALIIAGHEITGIDELWLGDENTTLDANGYITGGKYTGNGTFKQYFGTSTQAACPMLIESGGGRWTSDHRLRGLAYLSFNLYWDNTTGNGNPSSGNFVVEHRGAKLWQGGLPNMTVVIRGKKIYDPRTGLTTYSNNSALVVADYLCDSTFGLGVNYSTGIDEAALITAANACDELVTLADGSTEKRFTTNGWFKVDGSPDAILGRLLGTMHGQAIYDGERWVIKAGIWEEPDAVVLTDDNMRAASTLQTLTSTRDIANGVKGTYVGAETKWQPADFPSIQSSTFLTDDGNVVKWRDIELPFTTTATAAQRLAKIDLLKQRYETVETYKGKLSCWRYTAGQTIYRTSERYGWTNKAFMVESVRVVPDQDAEGNPIVGVDLTLRETASTIYNWSTSEETPIRTPTAPSMGDIWDVVAPTGFTATESVYTTADGLGVRSKVTLQWVASTDRLVTLGGYYDLEYKLNTDSTWKKLAQVESTTYEVLDVKPAAWNYRIRAVNYAGNPSSYVSVNITVSGDTTPAEDVSGFASAAGVSGFTTFSWTAPVNERARNGSAEIRYSTATSGATWASASAVAVQSALNTSAILQTKIGTFLIKFKSANGVYSTNAASVVVSTTQQPKVGIEIVSALPTTDLYEGRIVYLSTDDKLYRYDGAAWTTAVPAGDVTGTLVASQIASNAITTDKLAAGAVTAAKISVSQLSALSADLGTVTAGTITAGTHQTASSGVRAVFDSRVMFRIIDPSYATRSYYRSGWGEPELISHVGADAAYGYNRFLNYHGTTVMDVHAHGDNTTPGNTPSAVGIYSRGDYTGLRGDSSYIGVNGYGTTYDHYASGPGSNYGPFTGAHDALILKTDATSLGDIVVDAKLVAQKSISNAITRVVPSSEANQRGVLGVVSSRSALHPNAPPVALAAERTEASTHDVLAEDYADLPDTHDRLTVNAVGEGLINVCGQGGDIAIGDLIVTSDLPGKGMRQADDIIRGYTVAKAREAATFATAGEVKTIACIYVSG